MSNSGRHLAQRYAHLRPDHLRRAVKALDEKLDAAKSRRTPRKKAK